MNNHITNKFNEDKSITLETLFGHKHIIEFLWAEHTSYSSFKGWFSHTTTNSRDLAFGIRITKKLFNSKYKFVSHIQSNNLRGTSVDEFYCVRCDRVLSNNRKRQRGVSGGNKCKECYNLGRSEERQKNPQAKIKINLQSYTNIAYKRKCRGKPGSKMYDMIGCTTAEFRKHIENQFQEGWTHENKGSVWELDHIIPYNNFDLTDYEQVKQVMHYTNVRPLSIKDNRTKGDKYEN